MKCGFYDVGLRKVLNYKELVLQNKFNQIEHFF